MVKLPRFSATTALSVVIANMVGTGVFTSLGYQLVDIQSGFVLLLLWFVGGVAALCGALTYAELGASMPRSGGEYNFLTELYHPAMGFVSGWISATVGFAAPVALAAITFGAYLSAALGHIVAIDRTVAAILLVLVLTVVHGISRTASGKFQQWLTFSKIFLILVFCALIAWFARIPTGISFLPEAGDLGIATSSAFAISLIYVNYAYAGWNAATYITSEIDNPKKNIPLVLVGGTLLVMVLYLILNAVFLYAAPVTLMQGKIEIGVIVAEATFGQTGALIMGFVLALMLISTVSAMTIAGPRVLQVIGQDFSVFSRLSKTNQYGVPTTAIYFQSALAVIFISTSSFESVLVFSSFILGLNSLFAVAGVFILRSRNQESPSSTYQTFGYPLTPLIYISITLWTLIFITINRPIEAGVGFGIILFGLIIYFMSLRMMDSNSKYRAKGKV